MSVAKKIIERLQQFVGELEAEFADEINKPEPGSKEALQKACGTSLRGLIGMTPMEAMSELHAQGMTHATVRVILGERTRREPTNFNRLNVKVDVECKITSVVGWY